MVAHGDRACTVTDVSEPDRPTERSGDRDGEFTTVSFRAHRLVEGMLATGEHITDEVLLQSPWRDFLPWLAAASSANQAHQGYTRPPDPLRERT